MEKSLVKGKIIINKKLAEIVSFKDLTFFFLKYTFHSTKILAALVLMIIIFIGTLAEVPYYFAFTATLNIALFLISAMIYGSIFYPFRKSTIFENIQGTKLSKKEIYLAVFISMFLFTGLMYVIFVMLFSLCIFIDSPILINDWFFSTVGIGEGGLFLNELNVQLIFWWYIAFILINFGLFYLFQNISNTKRTFFLFVFTYLILLIIYGSTLNPPEITMNYESIFEAYPELNAKLYVNHGLTDWEISVVFFHFHIGGNIEVVNTLKAKYENGHYISIFFSILVPHSWINSFCVAAWKGTALKLTTINFKFTEYGQTFESPSISYQNDFLKDAPIWKIGGQIWWALAMYLWIVYFGLLYFIGTTISKIKSR